jgi:hypothetical protein
MEHGKEIWDVAHHDIPERHEFGKAFGIPKFPTFKPGISPIPAREDHEHGAGGATQPVPFFVSATQLRTASSIFGLDSLQKILQVDYGNGIGKYVQQDKFSWAIAIRGIRYDDLWVPDLLKLRCWVVTSWNSYLRRNDDDTVEATFSPLALSLNFNVGRPGDSTPTYQRLQTLWSTNEVPCTVFDDGESLGFASWLGGFANFGESIPSGYCRIGSNQYFAVTDYTERQLKADFRFLYYESATNPFDFVQTFTSKWNVALEWELQVPIR